LYNEYIAKQYQLVKAFVKHIFKHWDIILIVADNKEKSEELKKNRIDKAT